MTLDVDPVEVGKWWRDSQQWREFSLIQDADGFQYPADPEGARYRYVWMEAYVDLDMTQHYLLDVRTGVTDAGGPYENRQYVAVSVLNHHVRTDLHEAVSTTNEPATQHRLRFLDGMRWFANFVVESENMFYAEEL